MANQKRRIVVDLGGAGETTGALAMEQNKQFRPGYSLSCIEPSSNNPRRPDLNQAGVTLELIKKLARTPTETIDQFQDRMERWIDEQGFSPAAKDVWFSLMTLAVSIGEKRGVIQPVTAELKRPTDTVARLVAGERRYLASWLIGMDGIDVILRASGDSAVDALLENTQRRDLSLAALIDALRQYQDTEGRSLSVRDIMRLTGHSRGNSGVIRQVLALDTSHDAWKALLRGDATRVYHLQKLLNPTAACVTKTGQGATETEENKEGSRPSDQKTETEQKTEAPKGRGGGGAGSNHDMTGRSSAHARGRSPECPNLDAQAGASESRNMDWNLIQSWLLATVDHSGQWRDRIAEIDSPTRLYTVIRDMAEASNVYP